MKVGRRATAILLAALCLGAAPAWSQHDLGLGETRDIVPRYLLQDVNGRARLSEDFRGYFQLIAFGYTFCPDVCPTTLSEMAAILNALGPLAERLKPIFISVDPERDTLKVLREYTAFFDPRIVGLTGSPALVSRAAQNFKVRYQKVPKDDGNYAVDHSAGMFLLGPDGAFLKKFGYGTPVAEIAAALRQLLENR
ncbi:MAG: SCO family protein [Rhodocyclaceae bacterium]|nr:SCO family protein [Rhodocyclaceae bacterium]